MKRFVLLLVVSMCCSAKNKVVFLYVEKLPQKDVVQKVDVVLDGDPAGDYLDASKYHLVGLNSALPGGELHWIDLASVLIEAHNTIVTLVPKNAADIANAKQLLLFVANEPAVAQSKYEKNPATPAGKPSKDSSDIYLNGSYSPGIHSGPQYSIDTSVGVLFPLLPASESNYGSLGFLATVKSDKRPTADPDSYRFFGVYQRVLNKEPHWPLEGVLFTWLYGGAEFDHKANNINFISSPLLDFPIRLRGKIHSKIDIVPVLTPEIGMEIGNNFTNAVTSGGQGFIARGVVGGNFSMDFKPNLPLFQNIHLASSYKLRLPAEPQVFTLTKTNAAGKMVDDPFLSSQPRHYIKNEISFGLWKPLSFSVTHEYGAIPPAFRLVDHKVTFGLTLAMQPKDSLAGQLTGK
jgi:hypothetical protein